MISWIFGGVETILDDGENGVYLLGHDGFGMPAFHRLEERGLLQHGVTDRGYLLDARTINLVIGVKGTSLENFYQKRYQMINQFKPSEQAGILRWKLGGVTRQINGYLVGGLELSDGDRDHLFQKIPISIKCPDPTWYDPSGKLLEFGVGGGSDTFEVPLVIPMTVGASSISSSQSIVYSGSVRSFPVISITGPISNCKIVNNTTGDVLDFTGVTIPADRTYTIDLRYGRKTVVDDLGNNQISKLTTDSDLATWCLEADPVAAGGSNSIGVSGSNVTAETAIRLTFYERYIGL